jgi:hypothetical protein
MLLMAAALENASMGISTVTDRANRVAGKVKLVAIVVVVGAVVVLAQLAFGAVYPLAAVLALPGLVLTVTAGAVFGLLTVAALARRRLRGSRSPADGSRDPAGSGRCTPRRQGRGWWSRPFGCRLRLTR